MLRNASKWTFELRLFVMKTVPKYHAISHHAQILINIMPSLSFPAFKIPQQKKKAPILQLIYCKHTLYNQTYVNTGILHPYIICNIILINIAKHLISKPCVLICYYYSLQTSLKTFHLILEPGCRHLLPFCHKSMSEIRH